MQDYGSYAWHATECALQIYEVSLEYLWRLSSYREDTILYMQVLWFLSMTRRLNVLYKCMKFHWNTSNGYLVRERTWNSIANDQR